MRNRSGSGVCGRWLGVAVVVDVGLAVVVAVTVGIWVAVAVAV